jgi:hypothetical protein
MPLLLILGLLGALLPATAAVASPYTVTTHVELEQAIFDGNAAGVPYEIFIDLAGTLTVADDLPTSTQAVTIRGRSAAETTVDGDGHSLFRGTSTVDVMDLTVTGGTVIGLDGGAVAAVEAVTITDSVFEGNVAVQAVSGGEGGAVTVRGSSPTATIVNSAFIGNEADGDAGAVQVQGNDPGDTAALYVSGSTFTGNISGDDGGALYARGRQTGTATVSIVNSVFTGNEADDDGGVIYARTEEAAVDVTIQGSDFVDNVAHGTGRGGVLRARSDINEVADVQVTGGSTFTGNSAGHEGGALWVEGTVKVHMATFADNHGLTDDAGAIWVRSDADIRNSTFVGNTAPDAGGAVEAGGSVVVQNSTFTGNEAGGEGGALSAVGGTVDNSTIAGNVAVDGALHGAGGETIVVRNSLLWDNSDADCSGDVDAVGGHNLGGDASCGLDPSVGDVTGQDPKLSPLANNGGFTQTMAIAADSPAVDAGDAATCLDTDQRGVARPQGDGCDIGAFEVSADDDGVTPIVGPFCPPGLAQSGFTDVGRESPHAEAIDCLVFREITQGISDTLYGPSRPVTRGQMASFVARTLDALGADLPPAEDQGFEDVPEGYVHTDNINRLAAVEIVLGRTPTVYDPQREVRRDQMASFLMRAAAFALGEPLPDGPPAFPDVDPDNVHADNINSAAAAGIALGREDGTYRPAEWVRRDQMASFLIRTAEWIQDAQDK